MSALYILDIIPLLDVRLVKIFSQFVGCHLAQKLGISKTHFTYQMMPKKEELGSFVERGKIPTEGDTETKVGEDSL